MKTSPTPKRRPVKEPDIIGFGLVGDNVGDCEGPWPDDDELDDFGPAGTFPTTADA